MICVRELVKQRKLFDVVAAAQRLQILHKGLGIARDVENAIKTTGHTHRLFIEPCARRVDEECVQIEFAQRLWHVSQPAERAFIVHRLSHFLGGEPNDLHVVDAVFL